MVSIWPNYRYKFKSSKDIVMRATAYNLFIGLNCLRENNNSLYRVYLGSCFDIFQAWKTSDCKQFRIYVWSSYCATLFAWDMTFSNYWFKLLKISYWSTKSTLSGSIIQAKNCFLPLLLLLTALGPIKTPHLTINAICSLNSEEKNLMSNLPENALSTNMLIY